MLRYVKTTLTSVASQTKAKNVDSLAQRTHFGRLKREEKKRSKGLHWTSELNISAEPGFESGRSLRKVCLF